MTTTDLRPQTEPPDTTRQRWYRKTWMKVTAGFIGGLLVGIISSPTATETDAANPPGRPATTVTAPEPADEAAAAADVDMGEIGVEEEPAPEPEPEPESVYATNIKRKDFTLSLKILERERFGSAGDSLTYRVEVEYNRATPLDPAIVYEITYEITGGEDGATIGTLEVQGDQSTVDAENWLDTASGVEPQIKVLDVTERGF